MPWTEDMEDPLARTIREKQSKKAGHLTLALAAADSPQARLAFALADNALTNFEAMKTLHHGFKHAAPRRFYPRPAGPLVLEPAFLPGVRVHVLGPTRDAEVIRDMNPPEGESYLRAAAVTQSGESTDPPPFTKDWEVADGDLDERDRQLVAGLGDVDPLAVAVALEKAVNGTSLVLAFEVGRALLLFPGDAQWGTWKAMLDNPDVVELLGRTTFLKVGHHGSHNATPVDFVDGLAAARDARAHPPNLWAMVSTRTMEMWPEIPRKPLLDALGGVTKRLARSDLTGAPKPTGFTAFDDHVVEAKVPFA
jgi:hypothetical protein